VPPNDRDVTDDRQEADTRPAPDGVITPAMDRHNGRIVILSAFLHYLAAPVIYVGIVQAALLPYLWRSIRSYWSVRILLIAWLAYLFWYLTLNAMPNLTLYAREALGREPQELSGWMMALRFGFKCLGGLLLGIISVRWGGRAPLFACVGLVGAAVLWAWLVPGHLYLLAFGIMGAGELGGVYFPNYIISISSAAAATRNLAIHSLVSPLSSIGPALHGGLADLYGFPASFSFGLTASILALILVLGLSSKPTSEMAK